MFHFLKRKDVEKTRIPPVGAVKDFVKMTNEKLLEFADTFIRLSREGFTDKKIEELMRAMRHPERGPCEPTQIVRSGDGILKIYFSSQGQELI